MSAFSGLTWDHPRGRNALEAAALARPGLVRWDAQPLEGFESAPIAELASRFDLLVLDHPHLGDAVAAGCLRPVDELFDAGDVERWRADAVGPSIRSYTMAGHLWALPLDAATQVSVRDARLVDAAPADWDEALALARRGLVATSLAGPHAFLSLCSIAVSLGDDPGAGDRLFDADAGATALEILTGLSADAPAGTGGLNPIGLLDRMQCTGDIGYIPLVYGYVNYASERLVFGAPPSRGGRIGSTIGGTGIAVTRRSEPTPELLAHLSWLLSEQAQRGFIPTHAGQPSARAAWHDDAVDGAAHGFYSGTLDTIERSWVRPRNPDYIPFQSAASAIVREAVRGERTPASALTELQTLFSRLPPVPAASAQSREDAPS